MNSGKPSRKLPDTQSSPLPDDLKIIPAGTVIREWGRSQVWLWRLEKQGVLKPLRLGRRKYYAVAELRAYLQRCAEAGPCPVPWASQPQAESQ